MDWNWLGHVGVLASICAAVATVLGTLFGKSLFKTGKIAMLGLRDHMTGVSEVKAAAIANGIILNKIMAELRPNGGSSLRDTIDRIDRYSTMTGARVMANMDRDPIPLFESDETGRNTWANAALLQLTGFQIHQVLGGGWINLIYPADRAATGAKWAAAISEARTFDETFRIRSAGGHIYSVRCVAAPCMICGKPVAWTGSWIEIADMGQGG